LAEKSFITIAIVGFTSRDCFTWSRYN